MERTLAQWRASGRSQRAYAIEQGFAIRQVGYWVRLLTKAPMPTAISLCNERGWTLSVPGDVPAGWLAELMRAL